MMPSFQDIQETIGFPDYFAQAERYAEDGAQSSASRTLPAASSLTRTAAQTSPEPSPSPGGSPASSGKSTPAGGSGIEIDWSSAEQPQPGPSSDRQAEPQKPEASEQSRRKNVGATSAFQAAAEDGQRAVESRKDSAEAMAEVSSLDEELSALGGDEGSSRSASAAETSRPTPVVEPDAIVVSGTRGTLVSQVTVACLSGRKASPSLKRHVAVGICVSACSIKDPCRHAAEPKHRPAVSSKLGPSLTCC